MLSNAKRIAIQSLRDSLTNQEKLEAAIELLRCSKGDDNEGQIVLYTGLMYDNDYKVVEFSTSEVIE